MVNRLHDRDDVTRIRFTRSEPQCPSLSGRNLLEIVDKIQPGGTIFHVIGDTPDDTGDLMKIVVDGTTVLSFELPRLSGKQRPTGGSPVDIEIEPLTVFRRRSRQGTHRMLDLIAADASRELAANGN